MLVSLAVGACVVEIGARIVRHVGGPACASYDIKPLQESQNHSYAYAAYPADSTVRHCQADFDVTYAVDDLGYRGRIGNLEPRPILTIGDSFAFGYGVRNEETYAALLGSYNGGLWGTSFPYHARALERLLAKLPPPQIIVWDLYPPHLVSLMPGAWADHCPGTQRWITGDGFPAVALRGLAGMVLPFLDAHSAAVGMLKSASHFRQIGVDSRSVVLTKDCYFTKEAVLFDRNLGATSYGDPELNQRLKTDRDEAYSLAEDSLRRARALVAARGIPLLFLIIPSKLQLSLADGAAQPHQDVLLPNKRFVELIRRAGFGEEAVLDLTDLFREGARSEWFFANDAHWTPDGHREVARRVQERIDLLLRGGQLDASRR